MDAVSVVWEGGQTGLCGGGGGDLRVLGMFLRALCRDFHLLIALFYAEPPAGKAICGVFGTYGAWMDSLGLIYEL